MDEGTDKALGEFQRIKEFYLTQFCLRNSDKISALTLGYDLDDGEETYYYLTEGQPYDEKLEDEVSALELRLANIGYSINSAVSPLGIANVEDHSFLGELVWRRD